jgi:hypothetical protein
VGAILFYRVADTEDDTHSGCKKSRFEVVSSRGVPR